MDRTTPDDKLKQAKATTNSPDTARKTNHSSDRASNEVNRGTPVGRQKQTKNQKDRKLLGTTDEPASKSANLIEKTKQKFGESISHIRANASNPKRALTFIIILIFAFSAYLALMSLQTLKLEGVKNVLYDHHFARHNYILETAAARIIQTEADRAANPNPGKNRTLTERLDRFDANKVLRELGRTNQLKYVFADQSEWTKRQANQFVGISNPSGKLIKNDDPALSDQLRIHITDSYLGRNMFIRRRVAKLVRNVYGVRMKGWSKKAEKFDLSSAQFDNPDSKTAKVKPKKNRSNSIQTSTKDDRAIRMHQYNIEDLSTGIASPLKEIYWLPSFTKGASEYYATSQLRIRKGFYPISDPKPAYDFMTSFNKLKNNSAMSDLLASCIGLELADEYIVDLTSNRTAELIRTAYTLNASADQQKQGDTASSAVDQRVGNVDKAEESCAYQEAIGDGSDTNCVKLDSFEQPLKVGGIRVEGVGDRLASVKGHKKACYFMLGTVAQGLTNAKDITAAFKGANPSSEIQVGLKVEHYGQANRDMYEDYVLPTIVKSSAGISYFSVQNEKWTTFWSSGNSLISETQLRRAGGHRLTKEQVEQLDEEAKEKINKDKSKAIVRQMGLMLAKVLTFQSLDIKNIAPLLGVAKAAESISEVDFPQYGLTVEELSEIKNNHYYSPRAIASRLDNSPQKPALIDLYDRCSKMTEPQIFYKLSECDRLNNMNDPIIRDLNYYILYDSAMDMIDSSEDSFPLSDIDDRIIEMYGE